MGCLATSILAEADYQPHMNDIYINRVNHGLVEKLTEWSHSAFHHQFECEIYPSDWPDGNDGVLGYQG